MHGKYVTLEAGDDNRSGRDRIGMVRGEELAASRHAGRRNTLELSGLLEQMPANGVQAMMGLGASSSSSEEGAPNRTAAVDQRDRDDAIEGHLTPIGVPLVGCRAVYRCDRRLQLIRPELPISESRLDQRGALRDERLVP